NPRKICRRVLPAPRLTGARRRRFEAGSKAPQVPRGARMPAITRRNALAALGGAALTGALPLRTSAAQGAKMQSWLLAAPTPAGEVWWCSLAGSFIARIDRKNGESIVVEPPTPRQGARRVWSDSQGRIWVSEWLSGNLSMHDPADRRWHAWKLPGEAPRAY